ncbi:MAG: hypothetical protein COV59_02005 [Candidatus Magasanikbacteria bacterium CG11_big_fil_rev_8_21_14_0_20_39_34]|uniref:Nudix hydrolase domain-containing protein n=1 Tax=Candidatus Magasanikbacteria bacterium CG11_big_fil_rev_8_21_14_0_20_39_34 TaxID=1974653 RepID=A0A2H0N766_9BACT|nr:MAG: hypothetical protein COV59_02005 [Candidatus Magasanikbacteria bacterium CG11_big_fil_rev_8_21_14_0_20_39_34]
MREIRRDIVSGYILSHDNKVLFGKKDPHAGGVYSDCWHIPGGGMDEGESQLEALEREIFEEVGISLTHADVSLLDDIGQGESEKMLSTGEKVLCHMHFFVYKIQLHENADDVSVVLSDDLVEYQWVDTHAISHIKLTPPSLELFRRLKILT